MKIFIKNKKSFALILAVFVLLAFSVTGLTAISLLSRKTASASNQANALIAFYAAEAAVNYYLEDISLVADFRDTQFNNANFTKTLGIASSSIIYRTRNARSATISFRGQAPTSASAIAADYRIDRLIEENSQTVDSVRVTSPTVVDQLRRFNLMVWESYDHNNNPGVVIRTDKNCMNCDNCGGGTCSSAQGQNFSANTYFNQTLYLTGIYRRPTCSMIYNNSDPLNPTRSTRSRAAWGSSGTPRNLYVNGGVVLSEIYNTPVTNYGVFGTLYTRGTPADPSGCLHGSPAFVDCNSNPSNPQCQNWPTQKPTITLNYYDSLLTKAASSAIPTPLTIDTSSSVRQLNHRNVFINGNVTISTASASPLEGPGNIIATGNITISNNAYIAENVGLIAIGNITIGTNTRIGGTWNGATYGYDATYDLIRGAGVLIYSRSGTTSLAEGSRVKAFCVLKDASSTNSPNTKVSLYFCRPTNCTGTCCVTALPGTCTPPYVYSQLQGLVYAEEMPIPASLGQIYGNALIEKVPSDPGQSWCGSSCSAWETNGLGLGNLRDTFPAGSGMHDGTTISELPLKIRGLYNPLITAP